MAAATGGLGQRISVPGIVKQPAVFFILGMFSVLGILQAYAADTITAPLIAYQTPFNVPEMHSGDITPFYKWTDVLARMDARPRPLQPWLNNRKMLESLPLREMVQRVDDIINSYDYVADETNWGVSDHWETPAECFAHGGDCEDFAIAKYAWLRFLGVTEERLRIAIVYDRIRNLPHAVLLLYINNQAVILDSQVREVRDSNASSRYRLIYSINRLGWWYPRSEGFKVSMVEDGKRQAGVTNSNDTVQLSKDCVAGNVRPECINAVEPGAR
jgi:predicted transglutaminase-like cysteine proteinase